MSNSRETDPFDPVPVEDKVEEYQRASEPEPDDERPIDEPVQDAEAPLDSRPPHDDEWDADDDPARLRPEEFPEV